MQCDLYNEVMQSVLDAAGVRYFSAKELCDVGRTTAHHGKIVALKAPPAKLFKHIIDTALIADWLREQVGPLVVNSGYRDEAYNRAVGGAPNSIHLQFNALDLTSRTVPAAELARLLDGHPFARYMGIGTYRDQNFVHVDTRGFLGRPAPARWPTAEWKAAAA